MTTRRKFLALAGGAALCRATSSTGILAQDPSAITLEPGSPEFVLMPENFTGLSYEMPQLYNPRFFSASNTQLVRACHELSPHGVLRIGGNLSDVARWNSDAGSFPTDKQTAAIEHGKTYWEWKLTDESVRANRDGAITPEAIRNLRAFLDATNWRLLYGLNFGSGTPERAADEAACVAHEIGNRLIAFQVGNESDFFGGNRYFRERGFDFDQYFKGYEEFVKAVRQRTPNAPFAGPDTAANMGWVDQFARRAEKPVLLSGHYYAMGPAKDSAMDAERLLSHNAKLDEQILKATQAVMHAGGVPFRMTEGNSCYGGGKPDVSDAFASALWGADYMLYLASSGYAGVNLHGGGDGFYTPIETLTATTATPRPLYYGMKFANIFAGSDVAQVPTGATGNVTAYLSRSKAGTQLAIINKSREELRPVMGRGLPRNHWKKEWRLTAASLDAKQGVALVERPAGSPSPCVLAPYSAAILVWD